MSVTIVVVSVLVGYFVWSLWQKWSNNTSGLLKLPLIGHWLAIGKFPYMTFSSLADRVGGIFQLQVGVRQLVVLNSESVIQTCFNRKEFAGRPSLPCWNLFRDSDARSRFAFRSMYSDTGCKYLRKSAVSALAHITNKSNDLFSSITAGSIQQLVAQLRGRKRFEEMNLSVYTCVTTVMGSVCFGKVYNPTDPLLHDVFERFEGLSELLDIGSKIDYLPFGSFVAKIVLPFHRERIVQPLNSLIDKMMSAHKFDASLPTITDFLKSNRQCTPPESSGVSPSTVCSIGHDLFAGGYPTTAESFLWTILLLAAHNDVQEKLRATLLREQTDFSNCSNKANAYLHAVILESLRFSSLVPLSLPHCTIAPTEIGGQLIDKGAVVVANLWLLHHDNQTFTNPYEFRPERFIDTQSGTIDSAMAAKIFPFGIGLRRCPGEKFAKQFLAEMLARLISCRILVLKSNPETIHTSKPGIVRSLTPFELEFIDISGEK